MLIAHFWTIFGFGCVCVKVSLSTAEQLLKTPKKILFKKYTQVFVGQSLETGDKPSFFSFSNLLRRLNTTSTLSVSIHISNICVQRQPQFLLLWQINLIYTLFVSLYFVICSSKPVVLSHTEQYIWFG